LVTTVLTWTLLFIIYNGGKRVTGNGICSIW